MFFFFFFFLLPCCRDSVASVQPMLEKLGGRKVSVLVVSAGFLNTMEQMGIRHTTVTPESPLALQYTV